MDLKTVIKNAEYFNTLLLFYNNKKSNLYAFPQIKKKF